MGIFIKTLIMKILLSIFACACYLLSQAQNNDYSIELNGYSSYINVPSAPVFDNINTKLSITAWIKPVDSSVTYYPMIISRQEGMGSTWDRWSFSWTSTAKDLVLTFGSVSATSWGGVDGNTPIPLNQWTYVSVVYDSGSVIIYINGNQDASGTIPLSDLTHVQDVDLKIGSYWIDYFPGFIDDVTIWEEALSQAQIQEYMNCSPNGNENGLIGYWDLNDGTGNTATDLTSFGNNGNVYNGSWSTDMPSFNCDLSIVENFKNEKNLIKIVDLMGCETEDKPNTTLIYIYSDGTTEKVYRME